MLNVADDLGRQADGFAAGALHNRDRLLAQHYQDVCRIARRILTGHGDRLHFTPTDLAHEAAIRMLRLDRIVITDDRHLLALAARIMRQVLLDTVRQARAAKRSSPMVATWSDRDEADARRFDPDVLGDALSRLAADHPERARVVELRYREGLTLEDVAVRTGESLSTVKRRWRAARLWLLDDLGHGAV